MNKNLFILICLYYFSPLDPIGLSLCCYFYILTITSWRWVISISQVRNLRLPEAKLLVPGMKLKSYRNGKESYFQLFNRHLGLTPHTGLPCLALIHGEMLSLSATWYAMLFWWETCPFLKRNGARVGRGWEQRAFLFSLFHPIMAFCEVPWPWGASLVG